jgi:hypothetical protein|tara:strand:- start:58 stop:213 length:156 start_codon:yes stop_codon:yes gene_type:complete
MTIEEETNPRVTQRKRNKREAEEYKKLYAFPWDIPIWFLVALIIGLLFLVF